LLEKVLDEGPGRRPGWRRFSTKVQDEAWLEKVLEEGSG
jgi:hypothetical protein